MCVRLTLIIVILFLSSATFSEITKRFPYWLNFNSINSERICLKHLVNLLFDKNDTITILSRNVGDYDGFIMNQMLVLLNPYASSYLNFIISPGVVLFLKGDENVSEFISKFKNTSTYNQKTSSLSKYLVVLENGVNISKVFTEFWYEDLMKVIVIQKFSSMNVHLSNPYWKENRCGKLGRKIVTNDCMDNSIRFLVSTKTFPGCDLVAGVLNKLMELPHVGKDPLSKTPGLFLHPLRVVGEKLMLNISYTSEDFKGEYMITSSTPMQESRLNERHLDLVVAMPHMNSHFYHQFEPSELIIDDEFLWAMSERPILSPLRILMSMFAWSTWICIFCCFFSHIVLWKTFSYLLPEWCSHNMSILKIYAMTLEVPPNLIPRTTTFRLMMVAYLLYSFHILVYFKGKLISVLTNPGRIPAIASMEELVESDITPMTFIYISKEIEALDFPTAQKLAKKIMKKHSNIVFQKSFEFMLNNTSFAVPIIRTSLEMFTAYKNKINIIGNEYLPKVNSIYTMRKGFHLAPSINEVIRLVMESGFQEKWLNDMRIVSFNGERDKSIVVLTLEHLQAAFILLGGGLMISTIIFSVELIKNTRFVGISYYVN